MVNHDDISLRSTTQASNCVRGLARSEHPVCEEREPQRQDPMIETLTWALHKQFSDFEPPRFVKSNDMISCIFDLIFKQYLYIIVFMINRV